MLGVKHKVDRDNLITASSLSITASKYYSEHILFYAEEKAAIVSQKLVDLHIHRLYHVTTKKAGLLKFIL